MARQLIVRDVEDEVVRALKRRAASRGRSAEAEHREILREALSSDIEQGSFKHFLASMPNVGRDADFKRRRERSRDLPTDLR